MNKYKLFSFSTIAYILLVIISFVWLRIGFVLFYPYKPLVFIEPQKKILNYNKTIHAGEDVIIETSFIHNTDTGAKISPTFKNTFSFAVTPYFKNFEKSNVIQTTDFFIPTFKSMPKGKYTILFTYEIKVSEFPIKYVTITHETEQFEII